MHRHFFLFLTIALVTACSGGVKPSSNPLIGSWQFSVPNTDCTEVYTFRQNGTRIYSSGEEVGESAYDISPEPAEAGFYKFTDTIVSNNGKPDCTGGTTPVGDKVTLFLRVPPSGEQFIMCFKESLQSCIGPFWRRKNAS